MAGEATSKLIPCWMNVFSSLLSFYLLQFFHGILRLSVMLSTRVSQERGRKSEPCLLRGSELEIPEDNTVLRVIVRVLQGMTRIDVRGGLRESWGEFGLCVPL